MLEIAAKGGESDFLFIDRDEPDQIAAMFVEMVKTRILAMFRLDPIRELNARLQNELNPPRAAPDRRSRLGPRCCPGKKGPNRRSCKRPPTKGQGTGSPRAGSSVRWTTLETIHPGNIGSGSTLLQHKSRKGRVRVGVDALHDGLQQQFDDEVHVLVPYETATGLSTTPDLTRFEGEARRSERGGG